jgi:D-aminoacyl-tRNA deacylase
VRALVQRVSEASVTVDGQLVGSIGLGLAVLLGVGREDTEREVGRLADKLARLRVFDDAQGLMNVSLADLGERAAALCVSQFTLYGDVRRGLRPSFTEAAEPERAERLYEAFCDELRARGTRVESGRFGARMTVRLANEGPVTLLLEVAP